MLLFLLGLVTGLAGLAAQTPSPRTHRLEATPATVAYGYYWADARPALRIASGDIIDVDTLLTNTPTGLLNAGVPPEKIQDSLKAIVAELTGDRRGPGEVHHVDSMERDMAENSPDARGTRGV